MGRAAPGTRVDEPAAHVGHLLRSSWARTGSKSKVVFTSDNQVTVIVRRGVDRRLTGAAHGRAQRRAAGPGHACRRRATTSRCSATPTRSARPTNRRASEITEVEEPLDVILVYPATATLHANSHEMLFSRRRAGAGRRSTARTRPAQQQSEANVPGFGTVHGGRRARRLTAGQRPRSRERHHPRDRAAGAGGVRDAHGHRSVARGADASLSQGLGGQPQAATSSGYGLIASSMIE